jgi:hypothetical protein
MRDVLPLALVLGCNTAGAQTFQLSAGLKDTAVVRREMPELAKRILTHLSSFQAR